MPRLVSALLPNDKLSVELFIHEKQDYLTIENASIEEAIKPV
jgi:hypothetical protein